VTYDVAIIGAGIVGAACADALTRAGASVMVVEPDVVGGGATAAGMGHIVVMDDSEAQFALTNFSRNCWLKLIPEMPDSVEFERRGTLWVAADDEEMEAVHSKLAFYGERNVKAVVLSESDLRDVEPNLRHGLAGGLLVPDDAVIYAPVAAAWLLDRALQKGAVLHVGQRRDNSRPPDSLCRRGRGVALVC
jgi:D-hydroxyproline dehydrogenase subunit beta